MTKSVNPIVLDQALDFIIANADKVILTNAHSTDFTVINGAAKIAEYAPDTITKANGDVSGRKATVPLKTGVNVIKDDTYNHVHVVDTANSRILYSTSGGAKPLTSGDKVDLPAFDIELRDPA